jgi:cytidyltransferase-like protein
MTQKAFVSGCYDLLHSGHIEFFQRAAEYGDLYVALGSDRTVYQLKGRCPVNSEDERLFMVRSIACVKEAFISQGSGILDFGEELKAIRPDYFVVNEDGNIPAKRALCRELGIEYVVLQREPHRGLPARSSTALRTVDQMPYRIDLAGGWLDQPYVSKHYPGAVITISIEPTVDFNDRSGMATSTRNSALDLWGPRLPPGDPEKLARILFCYDNPPGSAYISGSQDAIGIAMPGLNKSHYEGKYWPAQITAVRDELTLQFVERHLHLVPLGPREKGFDVLSDTHIDAAGARALAEATTRCWKGILEQDLAGFGAGMRAAFEAQVRMFPLMLSPLVQEALDQHRDGALGWKVSGAGGGGYLILVSRDPVPGAFQIVVRREQE